MITLRVPPHRRHAARLLAVTVLWAVPATAQRTPQRASTPPTTQQGGALLRIVPPRRLPTDTLSPVRPQSPRDDPVLPCPCRRSPWV